jgi:hypothetical protein
MYMILQQFRSYRMFITPFPKIYLHVNIPPPQASM